MSKRKSILLAFLYLVGPVLAGSQARGDGPAPTTQMEFATISGGTVSVPLTPRSVIEAVISRPYLLQVTEVTQAQYLALMGKNPSGHPRCGLDCPVELVPWYDAISFCNALSRHEGLPECYRLTDCFVAFGETNCRDARVLNDSGNPVDCIGYRLPTEVEWVHAAGAGFDSAFDQLTNECRAVPELEPHAWYCHNSGDAPHPVAKLKPNVFGLYDMVGNVEEWIWDRYGNVRNREKLPDSAGPTSGGDERVVRGGSFYGAYYSRREADREDGSATGSGHNRGFRVARTVHGDAGARVFTIPALRAVAKIPVDATACADLLACCAAIPASGNGLRAACTDLAQASQGFGQFHVCRSALADYRSACPRTSFKPKP